MAQYIPKEPLVAEIEKLESRFQNGYDEEYADGYHYSLELVKRILDTLEVKEVDFDAEWKKYFEYRGEIATVNVKHLAKHFFELGLKTQKGE